MNFFNIAFYITTKTPTDFPLLHVYTKTRAMIIPKILRKEKCNYGCWNHIWVCSMKGTMAWTEQHTIILECH